MQGPRAAPCNLSLRRKEGGGAGWLAGKSVSSSRPPSPNKGVALPLWPGVGLSLLAGAGGTRKGSSPASLADATLAAKPGLCPAGGGVFQR